LGAQHNTHTSRKSRRHFAPKNAGDQQSCALVHYYAAVNLAQILQDYGYPAVLLGTFLEGETIMLLGGLAAHLGYLSLEWVIACGFCGTLIGDQLYFFLGRRHGKSFLARRLSWQPRARRVFTILERHQNLLIVGFRFLYGLRSVTPFAIGMSNVSYTRFAVLNLIGAAIWAVVIGLAGFFLGHAMEALVGNLKRYEMILMASLVCIATIVWLIHLYRQRSLNSSASRDVPGPQNDER
jgi:membrane protein DedA with SNARE-associated domain